MSLFIVFFIFFSNFRILRNRKGLNESKRQYNRFHYIPKQVYKKIDQWARIHDDQVLKKKRKKKFKFVEKKMYVTLLQSNLALNCYTPDFLSILCIRCTASLRLTGLHKKRHPVFFF